jgi:hypothetical protein
MEVSNYTFLAFLGPAFVLFMVYFFKRNKFSRLNIRKSGFSNIIEKFFSVILPSPETKVNKAYTGFLRFTNFKAETIFKAKVFMFLCVLLISILVKLTNISLYTNDILTKYNYHVDLIYKQTQVLSEKDALNEEIRYFKESLKIVTFKIINTELRPDVENIIKGLITKNDTELLQAKETMANKIYYRISDYYKYRQWNIPLYILISLLFSFLIELLLLIYNFFAKADSKKELRFLKKLMILNGSIKPVDFMKLLKVMIGKSKYHKNTLLQIEEMNKKNSIDNREIYLTLIRNSKDINTKLFFEKMDQANNYDFDQAILNIENEFQMEKRAYSREVRKKIEFIHAIGIIGFMVLILILVLYLIVPWLKEYNMNQFS